jgi:hypothetical protein
MPLPPLFASLLAGSNMKQGTGQSVALLGQEARNQDLSGLINMMQGSGSASAASPALQTQRQTIQTPPQPLSDISLGPDGIPINDGSVLPPTGAINLQQQNAAQGTFAQPPQPGSTPRSGAVQQQPAPYVDNRKWGGLVGGDVNHPNGLVRMSQGYENGGLAGALGYLMTNMDKQQTIR